MSAVNISKDSKGFDDIDKFWSTVTVTEESGIENDESSLGEFSYDTSSTISESSDEESPVYSGESNRESVSRDSNISASLSLHENDDEDTDVQEGASDSEISERNTPQKRFNNSRRQSRVRFDASVTQSNSKSSRRLSAPASLASSNQSSAKIQQSAEKSFSMDSDSPFFVEGRLSEIPQGEDEVERSSAFENNDNDSYLYENDAPFPERSSVSELSSKTPTPTTPSIRSSVSTNKSRSFSQSSKKSALKSRKSSRVRYHDTPGSAVTTPGGKNTSDVTYNDDEEDLTNSEGETDTGADTTLDQSLVDTSYLQAARSGDLDKSSLLELEQDEEDSGMRRSKRVTKGQRVQFWKNERPRYMRGRMVGMLEAEPTPAKPKRSGATKKKSAKSKQSKKLFEDESDDSFSGGDGGKRISQAKRFPSSQLPKNVKFVPRSKVDSYSVWDDVLTAPMKSTIIHLNDTAPPPTQLPITAQRPPGKDVVGVAAQSFNIPEIPQKMSGWISGFCELPPGGIKDAEGVGECCQVFQVASCQDGSVEFGLAHPSEEEWVDELAQRTVLKAKDSFYVPPGNIYRLENHSKVEPCFIFWTIIRPLDESNADNSQLSS